MSGKSDKSGANCGSDEMSSEEVCVEFCAAIDSQLLNSKTNSIKFMGLDTNQVIVQMSGNTFFGGHFQHVFGTNVLFEVKDNPKNEKNKSKESVDSNAAKDKEKTIQYIGKSSQKLVMKRVFLESHPNHSNDSSEKQTIGQTLHSK